MQNAEAGPSGTGKEPTPPPVPEVVAAPQHPLPSTQFYSVEYPGYVQPSSAPLAVERLGGQASVDAAFKRTGGKSSSLLELSLRPGDPFAHPIAGEIVATNNVLLKVVKRKRKKSSENGQSSGEYTVEAMGVVPKTARFRSECDHTQQYVILYESLLQAWRIISISSTRMMTSQNCAMP